VKKRVYGLLLTFESDSQGGMVLEVFNSIRSKIESQFKHLASSVY
jgi:hypothetical protein